MDVGKLERRNDGRSPVPMGREPPSRTACGQRGRRSGGYGIVWDDKIDFSCSSIYECGEIVGYAKRNINQQLAREILYAREKAGLTQVQLSKLSGIDQGDISRIEDGKGNPSLKKIEKIAKALNVEVSIKFEKE